MKTLWLTESNYNGKISRDFNNCRTEYAWQIASNGTHCSFLNVINISEKYDIAIVILPKREDILEKLLKFDLLKQLRKNCKKIGFMQEGPSTYFQDYSIENQTRFYFFLDNVDFIMAHNECDKLYYQGMFDKKIFLNRSLMIEDAINKKNLEWHKRKDTIIGGNFVNWYGGWNSYMVALEFQLPIFVPSMGRMKNDEKNINELFHLPYMTWIDWIYRLSNFKYAVHLMPTIAAGTFSLNCAYLKIPCIGNEKIDSQRILYPDLSVDVYNIAKAKKLARKLKNDQDFYNECSDKVPELYKKHYDESVWKKTFFDNMELILNKDV